MRESRLPNEKVDFEFFTFFVGLEVILRIKKFMPRQIIVRINQT